MSNLTLAERIVAERRRLLIEDEAYAVKLGLPLNGRYYCGSCHHHHLVRSRIGQAHEFAAINRDALRLALKQLLRLASL